MQHFSQTTRLAGFLSGTTLMIFSALSITRNPSFWPIVIECFGALLVYSAIFPKAEYIVFVIVTLLALILFFFLELTLFLEPPTASVLNLLFLQGLIDSPRYSGLTVLVLCSYLIVSYVEDSTQPIEVPPDWFDRDDIQITEELKRIDAFLGDRRCVVCMENPPKALFPCGHMICCSECASRLTHCPACRSLINRIVMFP